MRGRRAALAAVVLGACSGRGDAPAAGAAQGTPAAISAGPVPAAPRVAAPGAPCVLGDLWELCTVIKRLESTGLAPRVERDTVRLALFSVPGVRVGLGRGELQLFLYADTLQRARDVARLDTIEVALRGERGHWPMPATLVVSRNIAAVLLTESTLLHDRVHDALAAGLPTLERR